VSAFYHTKPSGLPRFGDVVSGFHNATLKLGAKLDRDFGDFDIAVTHPKYLVILTPCCSIEKTVMSLAPLIQLPHPVFKNPFFAEDPTRINRHVPAKKTLSPTQWEKLPVEDQQERMDKADGYVFIEFYVYQEHDLLLRYEIPHDKETRKTGHYMVNFKDICRVESKAIDRGNHSELAKLKILELSVQARKELRDKIAYYFARVPDEDQRELLPI